MSEELITLVELARHQHQLIDKKYFQEDPLELILEQFKWLYLNIVSILINQTILSLDVATD